MAKRRKACVVAVTLTLGFLSGCADSKSTTAETVAHSGSAAPATSPSTTTSTTSTTVPAPNPLLLRGDGFGLFRFGSAYEDVLAGIPLTVVTDTEIEYPLHYGPGYPTPEGLQVYQFQFGRTLCWDDGAGGSLCAYFGASVTVDAQRFTGWTYQSVTLGTLASASGATVNKLLSELPALGFVPRGDCYGYTELRDVDNIVDISLVAGTDVVFGTYTDGGSFVPTVPVPPTAYVSFMTAGVTPFAMMPGDCRPGQTHPIGL